MDNKTVIVPGKLTLYMLRILTKGSMGTDLLLEPASGEH